VTCWGRANKVAVIKPENERPPQENTRFAGNNQDHAGKSEEEDEPSRIRKGMFNPVGKKNAVTGGRRDCWSGAIDWVADRNTGTGKECVEEAGKDASIKQPRESQLKSINRKGETRKATLTRATVASDLQRQVQNEQREGCLAKKKKMNQPSPVREGSGRR